MELRPLLAVPWHEDGTHRSPPPTIGPPIIAPPIIALAVRLVLNHRG